MLTSKQRANLRSLSNDLQPVIQIGKQGVQESTIQTFVEYLNLNELVKVTVLKTCTAEPKEIAHEIASQIQAEVVQVVGRKFILYKFSPKLAEKGKSININ